MRCTHARECFDEHISAYFEGKRTGHFLLINTENYDVYQEIRVRLQTDSSKTYVRASDWCTPNGLPDVDQAIAACSGTGAYVLVGISQALMLRDASILEAALDELLGQSIRGYGVVLLDHCEQVLEKFVRRDIRVEQRVVFVDGESSILPQIKLAKTLEHCVEDQSVQSFSQLLARLEKLTDAQGERQPIFTVLSSLPSRLFQRAIYPISDADGIYASLAAQYADIGGATKQTYGTETQWSWLGEQMQPYRSFAELVCNVFGSTTNLSAHWSDVTERNGEDTAWLLWLSLKVFGEQNNRYLSDVLSHSEQYETFEEHLYLDLAEIEVEHPNFEELLWERRRLLKQFPENLPLIDRYCDKLGRHQKNAVFYLSEESEREKYEFLRCLSLYAYTREELSRAVNRMSKALALYMSEFRFDLSNTKLPESEASLRDAFTRYFAEYKVQKLTNRLDSAFLETVNEYAVARPYNKLQPRSSIVSRMDKKQMQLFFFDSLGVEYLSFILAKCEEYGLLSEVSIGRCELPSITEKNKEFLQYFPDGNWCKIEQLDEMKHHSQIYNYQKCVYPTHLFEELEVIEEQLRKIQSMLLQGMVEKALIVSDHGASRLAVRYGHEVAASIALEESGEHSGRCCPADEDPDLPFAAYEDGYAVLANYERFKGGRKANVEVHGGASLEEVLVPVIVLSKKPSHLEICFVNPVIPFGHATELTLYSNIPLQHPRIYVKGEPYDGVFVEDQRHAKFSLPNIKRKGSYTADVYDGGKNLSITLEFQIQKATRVADAFVIE